MDSLCWVCPTRATLSCAENNQVVTTGRTSVRLSSDSARIGCSRVQNFCNLLGVVHLGQFHINQVPHTRCAMILLIFFLLIPVISSAQTDSECDSLVGRDWRNSLGDVAMQSFRFEGDRIGKDEDGYQWKDKGDQGKVAIITEFRKGKIFDPDWVSVIRAYEYKFDKSQPQIRLRKYKLVSIFSDSSNDVGTDKDYVEGSLTVTDYDSNGQNEIVFCYLYRTQEEYDTMKCVLFQGSERITIAGIVSSKEESEFVSTSKESIKIAAADYLRRKWQCTVKDLLRHEYHEYREEENR